MAEQQPTIFVPSGAEFFVPGDVRVEVLGERRPEPRPAKAKRERKPAPDRKKEKRPNRSGKPSTYANRKERWAAWRPSWIEWPAGWDEEESGGGPDTPLAVPPEILALAEQAMTHWKMKVSGMTLAATKPEKGWGAIWRIETDQGPRSFKLLHRPFERNLFSIHAQEYLTQQKFRVAPLVPSREGTLYSVLANRMFICTKWIEGLHPASKVTVEGAADLCHGLGDFHRFSKGYQPPAEAYFATRMHRWPGVYKKVRTKIDWFEHLATVYSEMPASKLLLQVLPRFRSQADEALARLEASAYHELVARGPQAWGLVHQSERSQRRAACKRAYFTSHCSGFQAIPTGAGPFAPGRTPTARLFTTVRPLGV